MKSVLDVLKATTTFLQERGFEHPRREAEELLARALKISRMDLYLDYERPLLEEELAVSRSYLQRRLKGEPFPYIAGKEQFLQCELIITPAVLIPRQETEILAETVAKQIQSENHENKRLLDLCCGSGCLGLSIKMECPHLQVTLSDLSEEALAVAKQNGALNELKVQYAQGDLLEPLTGQKFDYVVCNPPYISEEAYTVLSSEVRDYEPKVALVSGQNGCEIYAKLARSLPAVLNPGAKVWFEIGYDQGISVPALFDAPCWKSKRVTKDWAGHDRFFFLEFE